MEFVNSILGAVSGLTASLGEFKAAGILQEIMKLLAGIDFKAFTDLLSNFLGVFGQFGA